VLDELQLRALSGMHMYPELFQSTPVYITGQEPWMTIRRALEAYHSGKVKEYDLLRGMVLKYGDDTFLALIAVIENAASVPRKRWAETQIRILTSVITEKHKERYGAA